jgi:hypothetical protein
VDDFREWIAQQQDAALTIGIGEDAFWEMTPRRFHERWDIFQRREEREWHRAAWMVHHIMAAFVGSKNAPSVDRLLGRVTDA